MTQIQIPRRIRILAGSSLLLLLSVCPAFSMGWNGIQPLKSSRADVIKILGEPAVMEEDYYRGWPVFKGKDYRVSVSWVRSDCFSDWESVPDWKADQSSLVYQITLDPRTKKPSSEYPDLKILTDSVNEVEIFGPIWNASNSLYGIGYSESPDQGVFGVYYFPTSGQEEIFKRDHLPCKKVSK